MEHSLGRGKDSRFGDPTVRLVGPYIERISASLFYPFMLADWGDPKPYPLRWIKNSGSGYSLENPSQLEKILKIMATHGVLYGVDLYAGPGIDLKNTLEQKRIVFTSDQRIGFYVDPARIEMYEKSLRAGPQPSILEVMRSEPELFAEELEIARLRLDPARIMAAARVA